MNEAMTFDWHKSYQWDSGGHWRQTNVKHANLWRGMVAQREHRVPTEGFWCFSSVNVTR